MKNVIFALIYQPINSILFIKSLPQHAQIIVIYTNEQHFNCFLIIKWLKIINIKKSENNYNVHILYRNGTMPTTPKFSENMLGFPCSLMMIADSES